MSPTRDQKAPGKVKTNNFYEEQSRKGEQPKNTILIVYLSVNHAMLALF